MAKGSFFSPRETFFPRVNPSLYSSILHRSPRPSAPSECPGAGARRISSRYGCVGTHSIQVRAPSSSLKPQKSGTKPSLAALSPRELIQAPSSQQPASSPPKSQQSQPGHTCTPHLSPSTPGTWPVRDGAGRGVQHSPEQDLALLRGLGVKLDAGPPRKLPGWKRLLL